MGLLDGIGDLVSAASSPYGTPSKGQWNLTEGSFSTDDGFVKFFYESPKGEPRTARTGLEQISDTGGRRKVMYEYPFKDGQVLDDLGQKGAKYTFNIKFWGADYQSQLQKFLTFVTKTKLSGTLTHPVLGAMKCGFSDYEFVHRYDEWNAVTIRATFFEDTTDEIFAENIKPVSANSALRSAIAGLTTAQSTISNAIYVASAALLIPNAVKVSMLSRLTSIIGQLSGLLGQLSATFSNSQELKRLAAAASGAGGYGKLNGGLTSTSGSSSTTGSVVPPVFQVGSDSATKTAASTQVSAFVAASVITPQQAVYIMNKTRADISDAIAYTEAEMGNNGFDIVLSYRQLVIQFQKAVEQSCFQNGSSVKTYVTPRLMSLRAVAKENSLNADKQNDLAVLNSGLDSFNFIPKGTSLVVPL